MRHTDARVTVLDKLTYAATRESLAGLPAGPGRAGRRRRRRRRDVVDPLVAEHDAVVHYAAESHNDNSLDDPSPFVQTNLIGTFTLLEAVRKHDVRYHHISTDEVYGDLELDDPKRFTEDTPYNPSAPYSATKAGSDLLVRAWVRSASACARRSPTAPTTTAPGSTSRSSSPARSPTSSTASGPSSTAPGENVRDWIHADDHCSAVLTILEKGPIGETYLIGADGEKNNLEVVRLILRHWAGRRTTSTTSPTAPATTCATPSTPAGCATSSAGCRSSPTSRPGLADTIEWYRDHEDWWRPHKQRHRGDVRREGSVTWHAGCRSRRPRSPAWSCCGSTVREDARGWFKENWQREKMVALGLPDFGPVQNNVSFNASRGATRGIHAEPWDKFVSAGDRPGLRGVGRPARGRLASARRSPSRSTRRSPSSCRAASATATRRSRTARPTPTSSTSTGAPASPTPRSRSTTRPPRSPGRSRSPRPRSPRRTSANPTLDAVDPDGAQEDPDHRRPRPAGPGAAARLPRRRPRRHRRGRGPSLDVTDAAAVAAWPWHEYAVVLNAAAYTAVDAAETPDGRVSPGRPTPPRPAVLARRRRGAPLHPRALLLGVRLRRHRRARPRSHRGRAALAAGGLRPVQGRRRPRRRHGAAALPAAHVVGDRRRPQLRAHDALAGREGRLPQRRRRPDRPAHVRRRAVPRHPAPARRRARRTAPTTSPTAARPRRGPTSPRRSSSSAAATPDDVTPVTTEEYFAGKPGIAPRPQHSTLSLAKLRATGFEPEDALVALRRYLERLTSRA